LCNFQWKRGAIGLLGLFGVTGGSGVAFVGAQRRLGQTFGHFLAKASRTPGHQRSAPAQIEYSAHLASLTLSRSLSYG